ncbi:MAG: chemotaxis protein CheB [Myxococcales bacterium]|nr:chemotaxis protein CheB [Myxococcales bacterium]
MTSSNDTEPRGLPFPLVGLGASAGGLAAFEAFLSGLPTDRETGMAFVFVQHLAPDHSSLLPELLRKMTRLQVVEVEDGMLVQPNHGYTIPPNHDLRFANGALYLMPPSEPRGHRLPIDTFFTSLAEAQHEAAIGIVLSGTGNDGTEGARAIKGAGGLVLAQTPETCDFDGMPRSVVAAGLADEQLAPGDMAPWLMSRASSVRRRVMAPVAGDEPVVELSSALVKRIVALLLAKTGHDFSQYKPNTVNRRVARRMAAHRLDDAGDYATFLERTPDEADALFQDLLIGVTSFFRDPEAFEALARVGLPKLFERVAPGAPVRVWCVGCCTGEEAYSIAILLQEHLEATGSSSTVQVFATDIDARAIATARQGLFPASIAAELSPARLARFFTAEPGGGYRVSKHLRELLIFSEQDVIIDPPFSRVDLIACRNLLIYFSSELQRRLIPLFHYALNPGGVLFLGTSEGVGDLGELFTPLDRRAKLFVRAGSATRLVGRLGARSALNAGLPLSERRAVSPSPLKAMTEQALLQFVGTTGALVNTSGDLLYLHGSAASWLALNEGEVGVSNVIKLARGGLGQSLAMALHRASATRAPSTVKAVSSGIDLEPTVVNVKVFPLADPALFLVVWEPLPGQDRPETVEAGDGTAAVIEELRRALRSRDEFLQATREQLETSNEELKSSNEEMQSMNEELRSANEEMETSREELQSVNEELSTVNAELHTKVADLSRLNNDMNNLLAGTGIATVFVDQEMKILRFTPNAAQLINLIPSDVGRPLAHLMSNLKGSEQLVPDARRVLDTLEPHEREVQTTSGAWFVLRLRPYRTLENVISGVVMTFADVTERKAMEARLAQTAELARLALTVRDAADPIVVQDFEGKTLSWNPAAVRAYGWSETQALALNLRERLPEPVRVSEAERLLALRTIGHVAPSRTQRLTRDGRVVDVWLTATVLLNGTGQPYAISTIELLESR